MATMKERARSTAFLLPALLVVAVASMVVLGDLAQWLRAMHAPGGAAFAPEQGLSGGYDTAQRAVATWNHFARVSGGLYRSPEVVLLWFVLVDTLVFVPAYAAAGLLVLGRGGAWAVAGRPTVGGRRLFRAARLVLVGVALLDLAENFFLYLVYTRDGGPRWAASLLRLLTVAKWIGAAFVGVALLVLLLLWLTRDRDDGRTTPRAAATTLRLVRVQAVGLLLVAVALFMKMQVPDTILTWRTGQLVVVVLLTLLLAVTQWALSRHALDRAGKRATRDLAAQRDVPGRFYAVAGGLLLAAFVVAWVSEIAHDVEGGTAFWDAVYGPGAPALIAGIVLGLSWLVSAWAPQVRVGDDPDQLLGAERLPRVLAAALPVVVGLATLRVSLDTWVRTDAVAHDLLGLLGAALLLALGVALYFALRALDEALTAGGSGDSWWHGRRWRLCVGCGIAGSALMAACLVAPFAVAPFLSAVGVVLVFVTVLTFVAGVVVVAVEWSSTRYWLPALFRLLRVRRVPVVAILLVWSVVASAGDSGAHWEVRRRHGVRTRSPGTLSAAFEAWTKAHPPPAGGGAIPLVVVAASGGGIRAATWTSLAMRCLFEGVGPENCGTGSGAYESNVLLASGISGGSVGLVEFIAHETSGVDEDWVTEHVRGDYVSPQLAWQLFAEVPRSLLHFGVGDRGAILEQSFENSWEDGALDKPLVETQTDPRYAGRLPVLLLNGSSVHDGCWVVGSGVDAAYRLYGAREGDCLRYDVPGTAYGGAGALPGSVDVADYLCAGDDLRLSTAGLLSARFPFVSPAARLSPCDEMGGGGSTETKFVLDGGDIEASASENALAAWTALRPLVDAYNSAARGSCIVPVFVQIDNGYVDAVEPSPVKPPNQLSAPLTSVASGRDARPQRDRAATLLEFTGPPPGLTDTATTARYAHLVPVGHPGNEPTLGWALSPQSQRDLREQLGRLDAVKTVRQWLTGALSCGAG